MTDSQQRGDMNAGNDVVADGGERGPKGSTTFTFREATREWLLETYPEALSINEALRMAISDARLVRDDGGLEVRAEPSADD